MDESYLNILMTLISGMEDLSE